MGTQENVSKPLPTIPAVSKSLKRGLTEAWIADDIKEEDVIRINDMDQGQQQHQIKTSKYGYGEKDKSLKDGQNENIIKRNLKWHIILNLWV